MKTNKTMRIGMADFIKAIKIADREMGLGNGFVSTHKVFKNKKAYNRKRDKKVDFFFKIN
jgi:hypothetical protein